MYCTRNVTDDLIFVGADDRRLSLFEGVYSVPDGVSYNSYLLLDEKTVLFDTVDKAVGRIFFENLEHALGSHHLDYVVVQHMEPDHSATLEDLLRRYPDTEVVCNAKTAAMIAAFTSVDITSRTVTVTEATVFSTGRHEFRFVMAPMVHWPEVMVSYDTTDKILFSADAFGTFGALNGALFADEVDFPVDYLPEARRYYCNIVGKYGPMVQSLLKKAAGLDIRMICPLHGFVWRENLSYFIAKYDAWSQYEPEEIGVMIAYASIYGGTENAANILACRLREKGVKTVIFDVSVTPESEIIAAAFRYSHLVFASATYNAGVFVTMDALLRELVAHNIQKRTVALIENGSWAPQAGKLMREILAGAKNLNILEKTVGIRSTVKKSTLDDLNELADAILATVPMPLTLSEEIPAEIDSRIFRSLTYGLFLLTAREGEKDNGCIINTLQQISSAPYTVSVSVNKDGLTAEMIRKTGTFNVSVLTEDAPFDLFTRFGFQSGRSADKFDGFSAVCRSENGLLCLTEQSAGFLSVTVTDTVDCGTHYLFVGRVTESAVRDGGAPMSYAYYFENVKPKKAAEAETPAEKPQRWICTLCGYEHEGELPPDFTCPLCNHGAEFFEKA